MDNQPTILFLCTQDYLSRERRGLVEALEHYAEVRCLNRFQSSISKLKATENLDVDLILHPDIHRSYLPEGLTSLDCPTACLHIDTYSASSNRARMSLLFDWTLVCHPGYPERFEERGHPEVALFPHAVRKNFYDTPLPDKTVDVAMVGRVDGKDYSYRRACMRQVQELGVSTNDVEKYYNYAQMADLYRKAKIGLNISRDSHLEDANLRCFEVMAGGALLLTPTPTELTELNLEENKHFITFTSKDDLVEKVTYYLKNNREREEIAENGREEALRRFTYDTWAERIVDRIQKGIPLQAPARSMSTGDVESIYVDYFSKRGKVDQTLHHLRKQRIAGTSASRFVKSVGQAAKATFREWQRAFS